MMHHEKRSNNYDTPLELKLRNSSSLLLDRVTSDSVVLEFGPAYGRMTQHLKEQLNCKVYAVEIDSDGAKNCEKFTENIVIDDIEKLKWLKEYEEIRFDYILFADVLEHLRDPQKVR